MMCLYNGHHERCQSRSEKARQEFGLVAKVSWGSNQQTTTWRGVDLALNLHHHQGGAQNSQKSWKQRSDQDGGSGGHHSGQRRVQVREKATGDLLVFIFVKIPLQLSLFFVKVKVFWSLSLSLSYSMCSSWKGSEGIESTRKMWLVSNSEIKAGKEHVDHVKATNILNIDLLMFLKPLSNLFPSTRSCPWTKSFWSMTNGHDLI